MTAGFYSCRTTCSRVYSHELHLWSLYKAHTNYALTKTTNNLPQRWIQLYNVKSFLLPFVTTGLWQVGLEVHLSATPFKYPSDTNKERSAFSATDQHYVSRNGCLVIAGQHFYICIGGPYGDAVIANLTCYEDQNYFEFRCHVITDCSRIILQSVNCRNFFNVTHQFPQIAHLVMHCK